MCDGYNDPISQIEVGFLVLGQDIHDDQDCS